jgi:hypothetical protein
LTKWDNVTVSDYQLFQDIAGQQPGTHWIGVGMFIKNLNICNICGSGVNVMLLHSTYAPKDEDVNVMVL